MILVTGGTGFIGQAVVRHLTDDGHPVRLLLRPSAQSPRLPRGVAVEAAVSSLGDLRGLRSVMAGIDTVYHLIGSEWHGPRSNLLQVDIQGTQSVAQAAAEAGVKRIFFVSHLDADRASAYPVLKAKGIAEETIRRSGMDYTILRSAIVYGRGDAFSTGVARLLHAFPFIFLSPGDGQTQIQPIWVEDLATCLVWALDNQETHNQVIEIGGPEYLHFNQAVHLIGEQIGLQRQMIQVPPPYLRILTVLLEQTFPRLPISTYWLDYLATHRTCGLDTLPRLFNLLPARFSQRLAHLKGENWSVSLLRSLFQKSS